MSNLKTTAKMLIINAKQGKNRHYQLPFSTSLTHYVTVLFLIPLKQIRNLSEHMQTSFLVTCFRDTHALYSLVSNMVDASQFIYYIETLNLFGL